MGPQKCFGRQDESPGGASDRRDSSEPTAGHRVNAGAPMRPVAQVNDAAGDALAGVLRGLVEGAGRPDLIFERHVPPEGRKDWNDVLTLG